MCHLIRVDNSFLKRLNQQPVTTDPINGSSSEIYDSLFKVHNQFITLVSFCKNDSDLFLKSNIENPKDTDNIYEHILHSCQHNLYHLAQMIYLRRALDRNWNSPIDEWVKLQELLLIILSNNLWVLLSFF
jgi:hypothetical protein